MKQTRTAPMVVALAATCLGALAAPVAAPASQVCAVPQLETAAPDDPGCDNGQLTGYQGLLVVAPHPDDETLGFAGLISAYRALGKPVEVVVVTDGDAYCEACQLWKNGAPSGAPCSAAELSNLATPEVDSFGEVRRGESVAAAAILGGGPPTMLGYPDTALGASWESQEEGRTAAVLHRSDFSGCESCAGCGGYGKGPATELTPATLVRDLAAHLAATAPGTLVATTHWLDGHPDHAALGRFVRQLDERLEQPRDLVFAVIHAHTPKQHPHPDCWYPGPGAPLCSCIDATCAGADPGWVKALRWQRYRPEWPGALPDDADYGAALHLCLADELWRGESPRKLAAVSAYRSQLGQLGRDAPLAAGLDALMDCSGYLISFVKRSEAFVLLQPGDDSAAAGGGAGR